MSVCLHVDLHSHLILTSPLCVQNDEVTLQRKVRTEVFQLEDTLAQVRKEYEMLRIEFEQTLAANEQAGDYQLVVYVVTRFPNRSFDSHQSLGV